MKKNYTLLLFLFLITSDSFGQIFITELADPNDATNARFVELYNAGASAVDLNTGYALQRYTNGNAGTQAKVSLTGSIAAGGFYIIASNQAGFEAAYSGITADQYIGTGGAADSNGDDQIQLLDPSENVLDIFGVPGEDGTGTCHEFEDGRAERIATVTSGNGGTWDESKWNVRADSNISDCTSHSNAPVNTTDGVFNPRSWIGSGEEVSTTTSIQFVSTSSNVAENDGTIDVCVAITNPDATNATTVDLNINVSSTAVNGTDYTTVSYPQTITFPAGSSSNQCITFTITDDADEETSETIVLDLENVSGGNTAELATRTTHTLTIDASDIPESIVITELMQNPDAVGDNEGEWFEIHNTTDSTIDLNGWTFEDDATSSEKFTIAETLNITANGYLLFALNGSATENGNLPTVDYVYTGISLGNSSDGLQVKDTEGTTVDLVTWTSNSTGKSMSLKMTKLNSTDNDSSENWETVDFTYGDGDFGTPGSPNDTAVIALSINSIENSKEVTIYPNPIHDDFFSVRFTTNNTHEIKIYNMFGNIVLNKEIKSNERIDVSGLNTGIYIFKTVNAGKEITAKLLIK